MHTRSLRMLGVLALVIAAGRPTMAAAQLPAAKDLIAAWATATNAAAYKGKKTSRATAAFDIPAMGMSAKMEMISQYSPVISSQKVELPGMGEMRTGYNGEVAWSMNPMQGASVVDGAQLAQQREDADPDNYSRISAAIVSSETVEKTTLGGQECYKVKHTWKSGRVSYDCFAVSDGMIVWNTTTAATQMGPMEITSTYSAYKDFGGIKRPATTSVDQAGQQFVITLLSWEWDTVTPAEFELPPEIKALTAKKP